MLSRTPVRRAKMRPPGLRCGDVREIVGAQLCEGVQRQTKAGAAALPIRSVLEYEASSVRFRDLPAQDQADARPARLGREEWHEQIAGVGQTGPFVFDPELHRRRVRTGQPLPSDRDAAAGFPHGVDRVSNQVDEQLLELIAITL